MIPLRTVSACLLAAGLAACGGGGDEASSPAAMEKYLGTWTTCQSAAGSVISVKVNFTLAKASDTTATIVQTHDNYEFTNTCSGEPVRTIRSKGTVAFVGGTQVGADAADKVDIELIVEPATASDGKSKWLYAIRPDGRLYGGISKGLPGASFDAQGYPSAIDTAAWIFTRK